MTIDKDDRADGMLIEASRDYNAPAAVPRDAMWARIEAARKSRLAPKRSRWIWPSAAVAAAAVIMAVGVVVGRRWERGSSRAGLAANTTTAPATTATGPESDASGSLSYKLVVQKHLANSEALITSFRSAAKRGEVDAQLRDWSKDMLSTTRMLEASGTSSDPTIKRLLSDLDLVLTQIKLYTARGTNDADDLDLIEESINSRGVMTKLRSTLPARALPAGT